MPDETDSRSARAPAPASRSPSAKSRQRFSPAEIGFFMLLSEDGLPPSLLCSRYGFTLADFFRWKAKYQRQMPQRPSDELSALRREVRMLRELVNELMWRDA